MHAWMDVRAQVCMYVCMWEFPNIRGYLIWGPYNKDPTIQGTILGSPIFGNSHVCMYVCMYVHISYVKKPPAGHRGRLFVGGFGPGNRQRGLGLVKDFNSS